MKRNAEFLHKFLILTLGPSQFYQILNSCFSIHFLPDGIFRIDCREFVHGSISCCLFDPYVSCSQVFGLRNANTSSLLFDATDCLCYNFCTLSKYSYPSWRLVTVWMLSPIQCSRFISHHLNSAA